MASYWMENAMEPAKHTLVDLGYVTDKSARDRADRLREHLGHRNFQLVGSNRLVVRVPADKVPAIMKRFRAIRPAAERPGYCWCTHTWLESQKAGRR
jgi:hypothetical protein